MKPYKEKILSESTVLRGFSQDVDQSHLVWHRDREDRKIIVVEGRGWKFQRDNHLPESISAGDTISISAGEYHRLVKGDTDLIVTIVKEEKKKLTKKQMKIARAAPPEDEITGADFKALNKDVDEVASKEMIESPQKTSSRPGLGDLILYNGLVYGLEGDDRLRVEYDGVEYWHLRLDADVSFKPSKEASSVTINRLSIYNLEDVDDLISVTTLPPRAGDPRSFKRSEIPNATINGQPIPTIDKVMSNGTVVKTVPYDTDGAPPGALSRRLSAALRRAGREENSGVTPADNTLDKDLDEVVSYAAGLQELEDLDEKKKRKRKKKKKTDFHKGGEASYRKGRSSRQLSKQISLTRDYNSATTEKQKQKIRDKIDRAREKERTSESKSIDRDELLEYIEEIVEEQKLYEALDEVAAIEEEKEFLALHELEDLDEKKKRKKKKKSGSRTLSKAVKKSLDKKADRRCLTRGSVYAEFRAGLGAYYSSGSRKGMSAHQWAHARVNSANPSKKWAKVKKRKKCPKKKK